MGGLGRCKIKKMKRDDERISSLTLFFLLPAAMAHHMLISLPATGNGLIVRRSFCLQKLIRISDWMTEEMKVNKESKIMKEVPRRNISRGRRPGGPSGRRPGG